MTNIGGEPVDMTDYSFDDNSRAAGSFPLVGLGTLAPGESGLIVESTADAFRTEWGLGASVKIAESNTNNLGRDDEINIYKGVGTAATLDRPAHLRRRRLLGLDPYSRRLGRAHHVCPARRQQRPRLGALGGR